MLNLEFYLSQAIDRHNETEAILNLIQYWIEDSEDLTLKHSLDVLEDNLTEVFRAICRCKDECTLSTLNRIEEERLQQTLGGEND